MMMVVMMMRARPTTSASTGAIPTGLAEPTRQADQPTRHRAGPNSGTSNERIEAH